MDFPVQIFAGMVTFSTQTLNTGWISLVSHKVKVAFRAQGYPLVKMRQSSFTSWCSISLRHFTHPVFFRKDMHSNVQIQLQTCFPMALKLCNIWVCIQILSIMVFCRLAGLLPTALSIMKKHEEAENILKTFNGSSQNPPNLWVTTG